MDTFFLMSKFNLSFCFLMLIIIFSFSFSFSGRIICLSQHHANTHFRPSIPSFSTLTIKRGHQHSTLSFTPPTRFRDGVLSARRTPCPLRTTRRGGTSSSPRRGRRTGCDGWWWIVNVADVDVWKKSSPENRRKANWLMRHRKVRLCELIRLLARCACNKEMLVK